MAIYAIGDLQGCFSDLIRLLVKIKFNPDRDRLWFTGDLVNRGPQSLETLRYIKNLGDSATSVLGNHDLHLLACHFGKKKPNDKDTLSALLRSEDSEELLNWLRRRPMLHYEDNWCLVHAGLPPQWDLSIALSCAKKIENILRGKNGVLTEFFRYMYGDTPNIWDPQMDETSLLRFSVNALTRMRYCTESGCIDTKFKGKPGSQPNGLIPWFDHPDRQNQNLNIVFGHWSTLGAVCRKGAYGIDTGCIWGAQLTALRIDKKRVQYFQINCDCGKSTYAR